MEDGAPSGYFLRALSRFLDRAIATAWACGFPAAISVLMFCDTTLGDLPDLSGITEAPEWDQQRYSC